MNLYVQTQNRIKKLRAMKATNTTNFPKHLEKDLKYLKEVEKLILKVETDYKYRPRL